MKVKSPWGRPTPDIVLRIRAARLAHQQHAAICAEQRFREALIDGLFRQFGPISNDTAMFVVRNAPLQ